MTLTVCTTNKLTLDIVVINKMANATNGLFVFGDGFEATLNMLEEDEAIEEHLLTAQII